MQEGNGCKHSVRDKSSSDLLPDFHPTPLFLTPTASFFSLLRPFDYNFPLPLETDALPIYYFLKGGSAESQPADALILSPLSGKLSTRKDPRCFSKHHLCSPPSSFRSPPQGSLLINLLAEFAHASEGFAHLHFLQATEISVVEIAFLLRVCNMLHSQRCLRAFGTWQMI